MAVKKTVSEERYRKLIIFLYSVSKKEEVIRLVETCKKFQISTSTSSALSKFPSFELVGNKKRGFKVVWKEKVPSEYAGQMYFLEKSKELSELASRIQRERKSGVNSHKTRRSGEDIEFDGERYKGEPIKETVGQEENFEEYICSQGTLTPSETELSKLYESDFNVEDGVPPTIKREGNYYLVEKGESDEITLKLSKKAGRVLLVLLEENQDPVYKKFTEKLSEQIFEQVF